MVLRVTLDFTATWPSPSRFTIWCSCTIVITCCFPSCNFLLSLWLKPNIWWLFSTQFTNDLWSCSKLKNTYVLLLLFARNLTRLYWASSAVTSDFISVNKDETAALLFSSALMHSIQVHNVFQLSLAIDIFLCFLNMQYRALGQTKYRSFQLYFKSIGLSILTCTEPVYRGMSLQYFIMITFYLLVIKIFNWFSFLLAFTMLSLYSILKVMLNFISKFSLVFIHNDNLKFELWPCEKEVGGGDWERNWKIQRWRVRLIGCLTNSFKIIKPQPQVVKDFSQ